MGKQENCTPMKEHKGRKTHVVLYMNNYAIVWLIST